MRIISKWKDYYDFVGHVYGGQQDNLVVYERKHKLSNYHTPLSTEVHLQDTGKPILHLPYTRTDHSFAWLFVAGKSYLCVREFGSLDWQLFDECIHADLCKHIFHKHSFTGCYTCKQDVMGVEDVWGQRISKEINQPAFFYSQYWSCKQDRFKFIVEGNIPVLSEVGFPSIMPAEQCYQNIAFYIANMLTKQEQPSSMTDKEKVVSHGFDLKKSFRK